MGISSSAPIAITAGEPSGIGPDLVLLLAKTQPDWLSSVVVIADPEVLKARAEVLDVDVRCIDYTQAPEHCLKPSELFIYPVHTDAPVVAGQLDPKNAQYVLSTLDVAIDGCLSGAFSALVTGPVHKGVINDAGVSFSGHTEYLQEKCGVEKVVMMLANQHMKVALASTHLPLKDVASVITQASLTQVLDILLADMDSKFGVQSANILVAGLNPHAGEGGHMGREEIDVIEPVLATYAEHSATLLGPLPADTLFTHKYLKDADAVLAMYHDQGLPVLKYAGFGESVNITLGLPMIRTSVDHGTALDLSGTGQVDTGSLSAAISMAIDMATQRTSK